MTALVLGATGQLGANLVRQLVARGEQVRVLIRSVLSSNQASRHHLSLSGIEVERVGGDLEDVESLRRACDGAQVVYHCAGYYPSSTVPLQTAMEEASRQTQHVLAAVRSASVRRLVFASTLTTIGFPREPNGLADETCSFSTDFPNNPYLIAKTAMERMILEAAQQGIPAVVVNPTVFFGPYDGKPTSGMQILMLARGLMPGYVQAPVNVIDVRDVAVGMIKAAECGRVGQRYILGNWNTTQKELNDLIAREAGVRPPLFPIPFALARYGVKIGDWACRTILRRPAPIPGFFIEMLHHMQHYDCSKAIRELDFPRSPVEGAIRDAIAWFRVNGYLRL
jgi:dihydroflavonol-4-reductase